MNHSLKTPLPWTIYPNIWRMARIMLFSLLFIAAGIFLLVAHPLRPTLLRETLQPIVGMAGLALGVVGLALPFYIYVIRRRPIITLSDQGLLWPDGTLIYWQEIKKIEPYTIAGNHNLTISLADTSRHFSKRPFVELGFATASKRDYEQVTKIIESMIR